MPELPEVETVVRDLRAGGLVGRTFAGARVYWPRSVEGFPVRAFCTRLRNRRIEEVRRRGKYIVLALSGGWYLLIHLRMSGRLFFAPGTAPRDEHERVVFRLDDGRTLRFHDTRKFGRITLTARPEDKLDRLGPEPLDRRFTAHDFAQRVGRHKGMLKPLLLNQQIIAGLGNIYVDEALFDAQLHPQRPCWTLVERDLHNLHISIRKVLRRGIRASGTTLGGGQANFYSASGRSGRNQDGLKVFRRTGEPCPRCGGTITRLVVGQRSTHVCEKCQELHSK